MKTWLSKTLSVSWLITKKVGVWTLTVNFTLCTIGALLLSWFGYKALADKVAMTALMTFAVVAYIEVLRLKEWGQQNLSDLLKAAAACDKAVEQGKSVEVNGKPWQQRKHK